jgi:hypothetical protein
MAENRPRFLPPYMALALGAVAGLEGFTSCWVLGAFRSWAPYAGTVPLESLPHVLCGLAVVSAALIAPLIVRRNPSNPNGEWPLTLFAALWQGAVFGFFLMVSARLVPLEPGGIFLASIWVALFAFVCLRLAQTLPSAYAGIVFVWVVALPVTDYMLAEIFLSSPAGSKGWQPESGGRIYVFVHTLLNISPATAVAGVLDGYLLDGVPAAVAFPVSILALLSAGSLGHCIWRERRRTPAEVSATSINS